MIAEETKLKPIVIKGPMIMLYNIFYIKWKIIDSFF